MPKIILTVGVSNSKKSTYAKEYIKDNPNTVELNRDDVRFNILNPCGDWSTYPLTDYNEEHVSEIILNQFHIASKQNKDVIISDTNLSPYTRTKWMHIASDYGYSLEYVIFNTAFNEIFYNGTSNYLYQLPDHVLKNQYKKFTYFLEEPINPNIKYSMV